MQIARTARRKTGQWIYGTPKSDASTDRIVSSAPWLADELRDYMTGVHPFAGEKRLPNAPLFPGRRNRYVFDWAKPVCAAALYERYLQPATKDLGLGSVRFHDLRHTFATRNLSVGEHYMQVSKWLGHSTFVLTLTTYADYINEDDQVAPIVRSLAQQLHVGQHTVVKCLRHPVAPMPVPFDGQHGNTDKDWHGNARNPGVAF